MVEKAWHQENEAAGHTAARKQRLILVLSLHPPFYSVWDPVLVRVSVAVKRHHDHCNSYKENT